MESWSRASYPRIRSKGLCYRIQLQNWMNILSDKFCSWVIGGNSPIYWCTPLPAFFDLCEKNSSKTPLTKLTILPLLNQPLTFSHTQSHCCVEFETEMTMPPRHIHSVSSIHDPPEFKFILPLLPPSTLFFVKLHPFNVCQYTSKSTHTSPLCWFYT